MRKRDIVISTAILLVLAMLFFYAYTNQENNAYEVSHPSVDDMFSECQSIPNGSVQQVVETTRMFINIPKEYYPDIHLKIDQSGASANYISNGGQLGYAIGAHGDPSCWSYYYEFDGSGTVDITAKSGTSSVPDYHIRFLVSSSTAQ